MEKAKKKKKRRNPGLVPTEWHLMPCQICEAILYQGPIGGGTLNKDATSTLSGDAGFFLCYSFFFRAGT